MQISQKFNTSDPYSVMLFGLGQRGVPDATALLGSALVHVLHVRMNRGHMRNEPLSGREQAIWPALTALPNLFQHFLLPSTITVVVRVQPVEEKGCDGPHVSRAEATADT